MNGDLPRSWPDVARDVVIDAARYYYREMKEPWPVPDVALQRAIEYAQRELNVDRRIELEQEASRRWIDRWDKGQLDAQMKRAIEETYRRLSRAERPIRPRSGAQKKSGRQLDTEIARALRRR